MDAISRLSRDTTRQRKPNNLAALQAVAYEDAAERTPPLAVTSIHQTRPPSSPRVPNGAPKSASFTRRPRTSPGPRPADRESYLSSEVKRDSGFAPSLSTAGRASYAESQQDNPGLARVPSLPTIQYQDDESLGEPLPGRSRFAERQSDDKRRAGRAQSNSPTRVNRINSFKGIETSIPLGDDFDDWMSDKVKFSNRGSLLFGGKRMAELLQSQPEAMEKQPDRVDGSSESRLREPQTSLDEKHEGMTDQMPPAVPPKDDEEAPATPEDQTPSTPRRLTAGRRKPSVQMLQAAIHGGRVLSAEEISFSMKVRKMYEHGDERAADWTANSPKFFRLAPPVPNSYPESTGTTDKSIDEMVADKDPSAKEHNEQHPALRSPDLRNFHDRQPHEVAGGIEDWEDVDGQCVDRYGFINAKRVASANSEPGPREGGPQRVATALRFEATQPRGHRKLHRGPSVARSSRSLPAKKSRRNSANGTIGSLQSGQTSGRTANKRAIFRSKDQKITEDASDMLHPPPGFEEYEEDSGKSASKTKRREREREDKWQKMARPCGQAKKGEAVRYDFDAEDPKLVERVWKGIPDRWRAAAWHSFLTTSANRRGEHIPDEILIGTFHELQEDNCADDVQIDVDVPRTISMHIMFRRRYRGGQRLLFRVLHAVSLYFPETGYVQGMASLAATLLCYYDEEQSFVMMVRLWQLRGLEQLFQSGFDGLMAALAEFEKDWLGDGEVANKLQDLAITSMTYGTRWYLTLFNLSIPFPAQLRVWDAFMLLGDAMNNKENAFAGADLDVLHATSAALIDATREVVLDSDFENVMKVLTSFIPIKDDDLLMRVTKAEYKMRKKRAGVKV